MTATAPRVVATGALVRLREKQIEDAAQDYGWRRDPELAAFDAAQPLSIPFRAFASSLAEEVQFPSPHRRSFAIETVEGGRHIGNVMYYGYDPQRRDAELGITIGDRDYWSHGYGSDAVRALLGHLFRQVGMLRIYLHTLTWNERARRSFERAGFRRIDIVQRAGHEFVRMEITHDEYLEQERQRATDHGD